MNKAVCLCSTQSFHAYTCIRLSFSPLFAKQLFDARASKTFFIVFDSSGSIGGGVGGGGNIVSCVTPRSPSLAISTAVLCFVLSLELPETLPWHRSRQNNLVSFNIAPVDEYAGPSFCWKPLFKVKIYSVACALNARCFHHLRYIITKIRPVDRVDQYV